MVKSLGTAAIYIAGGIPKNFINDSVIMSYIFGLNRAAVIHDGGLASTLDEAHPWGKVAKDAAHEMAWVGLVFPINGKMEHQSSCEPNDLHAIARRCGLDNHG